MHYTIKVCIISFIISLNYYYSYSQESESQYYYSFDQYISIENTGLYNGYEFIDEFKTKYKVGNRFFKSNYSLPGHIQYDGQSYFGLNMKYDLLKDVILIMIQNEGKSDALQLNKDKIDQFTIGNHKFIRLNNTNSLINNGFYEVIFKNSYFIFFKKHQKKVKESFNGKKRIYEFLDKKKYYLFYENSYHRIRSKKNIIQVFPQHKKTIKDFYRSSPSIKDIGEDKFWLALLKRLSQSISKNHN